MKQICLGKIAPFMQVCNSVMHKELLLYFAFLWCLLPCVSSCSVYKQIAKGMVCCIVQGNAFHSANSHCNHL